ncbi:MAG: SCP2 sterol-binding domain-containing protein [Thermoplasmata archaeon]|nr:SCP2 sterol-binding domain-containing protein [Thermoplasmata archaeon]
MKFLSQEWADQFRAALNANAAYHEAGAAWEGEILLLVLPDERAPKGEGIFLDLGAGACRDARYVPDAVERQCEFVYQGARSDWARLLRREVDPVRALFDGTFRIKGNLAKAMRFTRAAKELVDTVAQVPGEI